MATMEQRFWAKVQKTESCWLWTGAKTPFGYGWFNADWKVRGPELAHRVSFRLAHGRNAANVCHTCDVPNCVHPDHLYDGTPKSNVQDMMVRGRHKWASKTHCSKGHELTPENTYVHVGKKCRMRQCRICSSEYKRLHRERTQDERNRKRREQRASTRSLHGEPQIEQIDQLKAELSK